MLPNKDRIRNRFARAAATYDRQAVIQQRVAERLLTLLAKNCSTPPGRVLEIGCCTGLLTSALTRLYPEMTALYVNDLVPEFRSRVMGRLDRTLKPVFLEGDIESLALPRKLDLVISSSTFHWLGNLPALLERINACLVPAGTLCFSIYSTGNLRELREITGIGLDYYSRADLLRLVERTFSVIACEEEFHTFHFADPLALLHHLRETGVNALETEIWTRSRLNEFIREYERRFGSRNGVALTYHPIYCVARKAEL